MALRPSIGLPIVVSLAVVPLAAPRALADQGFLCGPDTIVYVKPEEIELKKQTDPCIAAHFGLKVDGKAATPAVTTSTPSNRPARAPIELKPAQEQERSTGHDFEERSAALVRPAAPSPGTDYRNVRVINAGAGAQWFKHNR